jgi:hypothetical protein
MTKIPITNTASEARLDRRDAIPPLRRANFSTTVRSTQHRKLRLHGAQKIGEQSVSRGFQPRIMFHKR